MSDATFNPAGPWGFPKADPADHPAVLQLLQAGGEDVRRDLGQALLQVGVTTWTYEQVADDEQRPPFRDQFDGGGDPAVLPVGAGGHSDLGLLGQIGLRALFCSLRRHPKERNNVSVRVLQVAAVHEPEVLGGSVLGTTRGQARLDRRVQEAVDQLLDLRPHRLATPPGEVPSHHAAQAIVFRVIDTGEDYRHFAGDARRAQAQAHLLVRTSGPAEPAPPGWEAHPVSLEELVLAYLREPGAAALPGPARIQKSEPTEVSR